MDGVTFTWPLVSAAQLHVLHHNYSSLDDGAVCTPRISLQRMLF